MYVIFDNVDCFRPVLIASKWTIWRYFSHVNSNARSAKCSPVVQYVTIVYFWDIRANFYSTTKQIQRSFYETRAKTKTWCNIFDYPVGAVCSDFVVAHNSSSRMQGCFLFAELWFRFSPESGCIYLCIISLYIDKKYLYHSAVTYKSVR